MLQKICATECLNGYFKRINYFNGMLLKEDDLEEQQKYFRKKLKFHNRLHNDGVLWGLCLDKVDNKNKVCGTYDIDDLVIKTGAALDCEGNEIIVCKENVVVLADWIDALASRNQVWTVEQCEEGEKECLKLYVGLKYCEHDVDPVAVFGSSCGESKRHYEKTRICEGYSVKLLNEDELPECPISRNIHSEEDCIQPCYHCPPLDPCCPDERYVILGSLLICRLKQENNGYKWDVQIDMTDRRKPAHAFYHFWEEAKQLFMHSLFQKSGWTDISVVIGRKKDGVRCVLEKIEGLKFVFKPFGDFVSNGILSDKLELIKCASPWVPIDKCIVLVTDDNECVLFAYADPDESCEE
jgi:hypothetical protein